jgi:hypothetical protein
MTREQKKYFWLGWRAALIGNVSGLILVWLMRYIINMFLL